MFLKQNLFSNKDKSSDNLQDPNDIWVWNEDNLLWASLAVVKILPANAGNADLIPGSGRISGERMATHSSILS